MNLTNPSRVRTRNILFLVGIAPIVLALLFLTKVGLMLSAQGAGDSAYDEEKFDVAAKEFEGNKSLNLLEPWIAPYNRGTALFRNADTEGAIKEFEAALEDAPDDKQCMVRVNLALSHEVIGDAVAETDREAAIESWQAGRDVLAEGDCPANHEDAQVVDERLKEKIEQQDQEQDPEEDKKKQEEDQKKKEEQEKKQKELEERNKQGREERKENQEFEDYPYSEREDQYHW